jgi:hypothetical protein
MTSYLIHEHAYLKSTSHFSKPSKTKIQHPIGLDMAAATHGFALVTPASRGIGFAFAQQLLSQTNVPVVATARKNCDELRGKLLSGKGVPSDAEKRLRIMEVDVKGKQI